MKKILLILAMMMFVGCGDDVTNINGYTDEQVQAKIDSTLTNMELETIIINDTIYQMTIDTVYKMVIDTVKEQIYDTLYKQIVDTVTNELVDTIYQRVIDTVYNELIDTIYQRVIDTVFKEISVEVPRDTTITLYDTTDGSITAKIYSGVVFKNVFYEAKEYTLGYYNKYNYTSKFYIPKNTNEEFTYFKDGQISAVKVTSFVVGNYAYRMNCTGDCGIEGTVYYANHCGIITKPDYANVAWKNWNQILKFKGWRMFDVTDAQIMYNNLNKIVSDTALVYLNTISESPFTVNITKYKVQSLVVGDTDRDKIKYICAYDLN